MLEGFKATFCACDVFDISRKNFRAYERAYINKLSPHLETWLRSTGWTSLISAICRNQKKALFLMLPASCIESITNMEIGQPITPELVKQRLEPHLFCGSRLFNLKDVDSKTREWAKNTLLVKCAIVLNPAKTAEDTVEFAELQIRIFSTCSACFKELKKRFFCSGCRVVCYCDTDCQNAHWKDKHKAECDDLKGALDILDLK